MNAVYRFNDESRDLLGPVYKHKISSATLYPAGHEMCGERVGATKNRTIRKVRGIEGLESKPSGIACRFFFVLLCCRHLSSETTKSQVA
jgi:hypothetical protein